jgi:hypothetical protein
LQANLHGVDPSQQGVPVTLGADRVFIPRGQCQGIGGVAQVTVEIRPTRPEGGPQPCRLRRAVGPPIHATGKLQSAFPGSDRIEDDLFIGAPVRTGQRKAWLGCGVGGDVDARAARHPGFEENNLQQAHVENGLDQRRGMFAPIVRKQTVGKMCHRLGELGFFREVCGGPFEDAPVLAGLFLMWLFP